jgi:hypothetical protein
VVELAVQIQEVGDVDVRRTEWIVFLFKGSITGRGIIDPETLDDELQPPDATEVRVLVNVVHRFNVLCHE